MVCKTFVCIFLRNLPTSDCCGMCLCIKLIGVSTLINGFLYLVANMLLVIYCYLCLTSLKYCPLLDHCR